MKKIFIIFSLIFTSYYFAQGGFNNLTSHIKGNFSIQSSGLLGKFNKGGSLMFGYYIEDYAVIRAGATFRKFDYRTYSENILEGDLEFAYTVYSPRYDDRFLHKFNFATVGGFALENVKVTSKTVLINPYPKYIYFYLGGDLEFLISDNFGVVGHFKQMYALNGSKDKLGNWRYDYGLGMRFYLWGKY